jgi:cytochrome c oxidase subunit II
MRTMTRLGRATGAAALTIPLHACQGWQSALDPQGPQARHLADLIWSFTAVVTVVWVLTMLALVLALRRRRPADADPLATNPVTERRMTAVVTTAVALTAITVLVLTGVSYATQKRLFSAKAEGLTIRVTGHQWWWEVTYEDPEAYKSFTTANEIHIPVGEPVTVKLNSSDVIHSFWVPALFGKQDLITGRENEIQFTADREGVYRGQCAEFCGWQHAHMGMLVVAKPRGDFDRWREAQIKAAEPPSDPERQKGQAVFLASPCVMCHQVRGTKAGGRVAPDLTHIGSRQYLAAGTLPMSRGNLAAWIVDPQGIKPGVHMPLIKLQPEEVDPLASYLEGLK